MLPKAETNSNDEVEVTLNNDKKIQKAKNNSKKLKKKAKNILKEIKNEANNSENKNDDYLDSDDTLRSTIQYDMPKPGPHAKSSEWRKWKMNQRAIRQEREEKRIIRQEKQQKEQALNALEHQNSLNNKKAGRNFTISIAIPGSVIGIVQSRELKTYVAGQIARAATLFCVDEVIVYNEYAIENKIQDENNQQLIKILEYLECPQYLRKTLFRPHKYLEHVGLLNALEAPHHFKINDEWEYREGVVTELPNKEDHGSWIDIGLMNKIQVDKHLTPGIRVTVKNQTHSGSNKLRGIIVSPETPRTQNGIYWGYQVRYASSFRKVLYESSFHGDYDLKIAINNSKNANLNFEHLNDLPEARRILIVFGGVNGIDAAIESDEKLKAGKMEQIFDYICESNEYGKLNFGSRSIRLEEAILISLSILRPKFKGIDQQNNHCKNQKEQLKKESDKMDDDDDEEDRNDPEENDEMINNKDETSEDDSDND